MTKQEEITKATEKNLRLLWGETWDCWVRWDIWREQFDKARRKQIMENLIWHQLEKI